MGGHSFSCAAQVPKQRAFAVKEFWARHDYVMDDVNTTKEPVLITSQGRPAAKLIPADATTPDDIFGCLRGVLQIVADIDWSSVATEDWDSLR